MVVLSKEKAAHKQNWEKIVKVFQDGGLVRGKVKSVVKGGLTVNVGVEAFLPGSQVDIIPPKDLNEYVGNVYEFKIVKVNVDDNGATAAKFGVRGIPTLTLFKGGAIAATKVVVLPVPGPAKTRMAPCR